MFNKNKIAIIGLGYVVPGYTVDSIITIEFFFICFATNFVA